jgi:hypothetical protein
MNELLELKKKYLELQHAYLMQQRQLNGFMMADLERQKEALEVEFSASAERNIDSQ